MSNGQRLTRRNCTKHTAHESSENNMYGDTIQTNGADDRTVLQYTERMAEAMICRSRYTNEGEICVNEDGLSSVDIKNY